MSYSSTGRTPRVYVDFVQYARILGIPITSNLLSTIVANEPKRNEQDWDYSPSKSNTYPITDIWEGSVFGYSVQTQIEFDCSNEFKKLLSTLNYFGIMNHNLSDLNCVKIDLRSIPGGGTEELNIKTGNGLITNNFILGILTTNNPWGDAFGDESNFDGFGVELFCGTNPVGADYNIGSYTLGKYYDLPVSNLEKSVSISNDRVESIESLGGSNILQYSDVSKPMWGNNLPFNSRSLEQNESNPYQGVGQKFDMRTVGAYGKRSWDLEFANVLAVDVFPPFMHTNLAVKNLYNGGWGDNILPQGDFNDNDDFAFWSIQNVGGSTWAIDTVNGQMDTGAEFHATSTISSPFNSQILPGVEHRMRINIEDHSGGTENPKLGFFGLYGGQGFFFMPIFGTPFNDNMDPLQEHGEIAVQFPASSGTYEFISTLPYHPEQWEDASGTLAELAGNYQTNEGEGGIAIKKYGGNFSINSISVQPRVNTLGAPWGYEEYTSTGKLDGNILGGFYSLTLGGQLPFLFQPDKDDDTDICMCKLASNSLSITRVTPNRYNVQMRFEEVWR